MGRDDRRRRQHNRNVAKLYGMDQVRDEDLSDKERERLERRFGDEEREGIVQRTKDRLNDLKQDVAPSVREKLDAQRAKLELRRVPEPEQPVLIKGGDSVNFDDYIEARDRAADAERAAFSADNTEVTQSRFDASDLARLDAEYQAWIDSHEDELVRARLKLNLTVEGDDLSARFPQLKLVEEWRLAGPAETAARDYILTIGRTAMRFDSLDAAKQAVLDFYRSQDVDGGSLSTDDIQIGFNYSDLDDLRAA